MLIRPSVFKVAAGILIVGTRPPRPVRAAKESAAGTQGGAKPAAPTTKRVGPQPATAVKA
jgi:hypothetical protein